MVKKIAVITPTFNRGRNGLLEKTIRSVLGQSFHDFVHIIVDDGSTDNTKEIVTSFDDPRLRYFYREKTSSDAGSSSAASNYGINLILDSDVFRDVTYVTFLHSDDLLARDSLAIRAEAFSKNSNLKLSYSYVGVCDQDMYLLFINKGPELKAPTDLSRLLIKYGKVQFPHHGIMLRRDLLDSVEGYDEKLYAGEDRDFTVRLLSGLNSWEVACVPEVLVFYRRHSESVSYQLCDESWPEDQRNYFNRKQGNVGLAAVLADLYCSPRSFIPKPIKDALRPLVNVYRSLGSNPRLDNRNDFVELIETSHL